MGHIEQSEVFSADAINCVDRCACHTNSTNMWRLDNAVWQLAQGTSCPCTIHGTNYTLKVIRGDPRNYRTSNRGHVSSHTANGQIFNLPDGLVTLVRHSIPYQKMVDIPYSTKKTKNGNFGKTSHILPKNENW